VEARIQPTLVLDTNVVLDWLLFADERVLRLAAAIESGRVGWISTPHMRAELENVLGRDIAGRSRRAMATVLKAFDSRVQLMAPAPACVRPSMRCDDPDDQPFIDLASHARSIALLTRDRAVLRLAGRALKHGFAIVVPERWNDSVV